MKVILSRTAERDLEQIGDWIAQNNPVRAVSFVGELRSASNGIGRALRFYPLVDESRDSALRRRVHGNCLIFLDIGTAGVEILHILTALETMRGSSSRMIRTDLTARPTS
ncbi:type II toxin-antitoxin system RelE/ParE family toxin [Reyranella sp.]|uniref:type II toxin-antitoxin system RelE/ParE family toxin n=1 Tax=Reyranella sp. TaxID=1929291 RepID=UPI003D0E385E